MAFPTFQSSFASADLLHRMSGKELVGWHRRNGQEVDSAAYLDRYRRVLISGLSQTRLLYLDTNYWIRLRDAELGVGTPEASRLLETLRAMVRSREALCVSQIHSFLELGKQTEASLRVTAELLQELTEGVAIAPTNELREWECAEFIAAKLGLQVPHKQCVWGKVGQIHKQELPDQMPGPVNEVGKQAILKSLVDTLWTASFPDIFAAFQWKTKSRLSPDIDSEVLAQVEERKKEQKAKTLHDQIRINEFAQFAHEQLRPIFTQQLRSWHVLHQFPEGLAAILFQIDMVLENAINEFKDRQLGTLLPGATILVELYALYEAENRKRPLTSNDWIDWNHAAVAMPYCDMFFTERYLAHQLRQELGADKKYGCEVTGTLDESLQALL